MSKDQSDWAKRPGSRGQPVRPPEWVEGDVVVREERTFEVMSEGEWQEVWDELGLYFYNIKWDDGVLASTTPMTGDKVY